MFRVRARDLNRSDAGPHLREQERLGVVESHEEARGRTFPHHHAVHSRGITELFRGDEEVDVLLIGVRAPGLDVRLPDDLLTHCHHNRIGVGHPQLGIVLGHSLRDLAQDRGGRDGGYRGHAQAPGQEVDRFAHLRGAPDRLVYSVQAGNASKKERLPLRVSDERQHNAAEEHHEDEIVHL